MSSQKLKDFVDEFNTCTDLQAKVAVCNRYSGNTWTVCVGGPWEEKCGYAFIECNLDANTKATIAVPIDRAIVNARINIAPASEALIDMYECALNALPEQNISCNNRVRPCIFA